MNDPVPFMTPAETSLLERNLKRTDNVFEWGSGASTLWLAARVRHVTSVEHQIHFAEELLARLDATDGADVSLLFVPPNERYTEGTEDDGEFSAFRDYVSCYTGRGATVAIIDGRARVACARWIMECAQFGPSPSLRVFLHDAQREQYADIWRDDPERGWKSWFSVVERVDNLMLLAPRFDR